MSYRYFDLLFFFMKKKELVLWPRPGMPELDVRRHHNRVAPNDDWPDIFVAVGVFEI